MSKKKSVLFIIIALIAGIAIGSVTTYGISSNTVGNTGTVTDMSAVTAQMQKINEQKQKIDAQSQKIDEQIQKINAIQTQNDAAREQEEKVYKEKINQILELRGDVDDLLIEYTTTNNRIKRDDSRVTDIRERFVALGIDTSIIDNNSEYYGTLLEAMVKQVDDAQEQANTDFQNYCAELLAAQQAALDEKDAMMDEYNALLDEYGTMIQEYIALLGDGQRAER